LFHLDDAVRLEIRVVRVLYKVSCVPAHSINKKETYLTIWELPDHNVAGVAVEVWFLLGQVHRAYGLLLAEGPDVAYTTVAIIDSDHVHRPVTFCQQNHDVHKRG
jgi:hypothetical protein